MLTNRRWSLVLPLVVVGALSASCDQTPPTAVTAADAFGINADAAATSLVPFTRGPITLHASAACLGLSSLTITGMLSGWNEVTDVPNGRRHITQYLDFTALSASSGADNWAAGPGAHEIWSYNLGLEGDAAENIIHEGRSLFVGESDAPDFILVHRVNEVLTPNLVLQVFDITPLTVECIG